MAYRSTIIGEYSRMGYVECISSSGISVENLRLRLVYSSLEYDGHVFAELLPR